MSASIASLTLRKVPMLVSYTTLGTGDDACVDELLEVLVYEVDILPLLGEDVCQEIRALIERVYLTDGVAA